VLDTVGLVGGLDVHKGHGGSFTAPVPVIFVVTEDFDALNPTEPFEVLFNPVLGEPRREVAHPEVSCFADHGGRSRAGRDFTLLGRCIEAVVSIFWSPKWRQI